MSNDERFFEGGGEVDPEEPIDPAVPSSNAPNDDVSESGSGEGLGFEELRRERDEYLDALRRLQAEFENFRKRTIRQQTEQLDRASISLIERLLPVLDALDLALAHANTQEETGAELQAALVQIAGLARATLEKEGLERIDEVGVIFDPTIHDAVSQSDDDDGACGGPVVADVMRSGYRLKGRVVRPAMVSVKG